MHFKSVLTLISISSIALFKFFEIALINAVDPATPIGLCASFKVFNVSFISKPFANITAPVMQLVGYR